MFRVCNLTEAHAFARWLPSRLAICRKSRQPPRAIAGCASFQASVVANTVYVLFEFYDRRCGGPEHGHAGDAGDLRKIAARHAANAALLADGVHALRRQACNSDGFSHDPRPQCEREAVLQPKQLSRYWRTDAEKMERAWRQAVNGAAQTGAVGLQGNVANALAAMFIACGQDVACVAEATTALTRVERTRTGELYASITLPNLIVGTVGGGTYLPTARECLSMLGCNGAGFAKKLAEICAVVGWPVSSLWWEPWRVGSSPAPTRPAAARESHRAERRRRVMSGTAPPEAQPAGTEIPRALAGAAAGTLGISLTGNSWHYVTENEDAADGPVERRPARRGRVPARSNIPTSALLQPAGSRALDAHVLAQQ